jgi:hypothetical protein
MGNTVKTIADCYFTDLRSLRYIMKKNNIVAKSFQEISDEELDEKVRDLSRMYPTAGIYKMIVVYLKDGV